VSVIQVSGERLRRRIPAELAGSAGEAA
jgi:hypothetical protein